MQSAEKDMIVTIKPTVLNTLPGTNTKDDLKDLYRGVTPRVGLGIWQTVCMVTLADFVKAW